MMSTSLPSHVDPELTRQLSRAKPGEIVQGVFVLQTPPTQSYLTAAETRARVQEVLSAAQKECGQRCLRVTVFENLQSFALQAPREVVEAVLQSPAINSAMANVQRESMQIEPIRPTPPESGPSPGTTKSTSPKRRRTTTKPPSRRVPKKPPQSGS